MLTKVTCAVCRGAFKVKDEHPPLLPDQERVSAPVVTEAYSRRMCPSCRPDSPWRVVRVTCDHCGKISKVQLGQLFGQPRFPGDIPGCD